MVVFRKSGKPEVGQAITSKKHHWAYNANKKGVRIKVIMQPAQSPDLNTKDLAFFASLQKNAKRVAKKTVFNLVLTVKEA